MPPIDYGNRYYCIRSPLSEDGEIYVMGDGVDIVDGHLIVYRKDEDERELNLAIAPGQWTVCFAASVIDGSAVAVEHWKGEISR